jgi:hypothetical protein
MKDVEVLQREVYTRIYPRCGTFRIVENWRQLSLALMRPKIVSPYGSRAIR